VKSFLSNLIWIVVTLVLSLLILELACRVIYSRKLDYQIEMSRYAATLKRSSAHHAIGHEHRPSEAAHLMGVDLAINSHGFRDVEYPRSKPEGELRVMLLGDSLTLGWGAAAEDSFAARLQTRLDAEIHSGGDGRPRIGGSSAIESIRVLNTGVGNYNTDQEVSFFELRGHAFDPDLVVLAYFINDAEPTPRQKSPFILKYSYLGMSLWGRLDLFKRLYLTQNDFSNYYPDLYADEREGWQRTREAFARLAALAEREKFELVMVLLPELHAVGPRYGFEEIHERVRTAAHDAGIERVVDLAPLFANEQPEKLWVSMDDAHPNARAHEIIARGLFEELRPLLQSRLQSAPRD
jgi:lysophospholipase L1-like esterase